MFPHGAASYQTQLLTFWFAIGPIVCIFALLVIVNVSKWYRNKRGGGPAA